MTLKNKNKSGTADNGVQHQQQGGGKAFRLTKGLSGDNLQLIEFFRKDIQKRPVLINTINTILNRNGITDRVSADEKYISDVVNNSITRKVKRDCRNKEQTLRELATKLQIEFLDYLKGLGTDGKPITRVVANRPSTTYAMGRTPPSDTTRTINTGMTAQLSARNEELEAAERGVTNANKKLAQIKDKRLAEEKHAKEVAAAAEHTKKQEENLNHLHANLNDITPMFQEAIQILISGEGLDGIKEKLSLMVKMLLGLSDELDSTTANAANINRNDLANIAGQLQPLVNGNINNNALAITETKTALSEAANNLAATTREVEEAEATLQEKYQKLAEEANKIKQEKAGLQAEQQKAEQQKEQAEAVAKAAEAAAKAAEAAAKAAEAARTAAEAAQREAKKQSANNRTAREASNAKAAELEKELKALQAQKAAEIAELNKLLGEDISDLPQQVVAARKAAQNTLALIDTTTSELNVLQQQPGENTEQIAKLELQKTKLEQKLPEQLEDVRTVMEENLPSGNAANNSEAANLAAKLEAHKTKCLNTLTEIKTKEAVLNEEIEQAANQQPTRNNNKPPGNQYVVAVNMPVAANKPQPNPSITITEESNKEQGTENNSANPTITLNTHTAVETNVQLGQETEQKSKNNTPNSSNLVATPAENTANVNAAANNRSVAQNENSNMRVALVIPTETPSGATKNSTTTTPNSARNESSSTAQVLNTATPAKNTAAKKPMNVALVQPNTEAMARDEIAETPSANNFEQAKETQLPESEEEHADGEEHAGDEPVESGEPKTEGEERTQEVILAVLPNEVQINKDATDNEEEGNKYLHIEPGSPHVAPESENNADESHVGGQKMTWKSVKRYFTPKKQHTKSKKHRMTIKKH